MKREFLETLLKDKGIEETKELIDSILDENGKDIEAAKKEVETIKADRDKYKEQLDEATESLEKFKDIKPDELNAEIEKLQQAIKDKDAEHDEKITAMQRDWATEKYFESYKFTSDLAKIAAMQKFKEKNLTFEDGKFLGADDFMNDLQKENPTAFKSEEDDKKPKVTKKTGSKPKEGEKMTLEEAMKYKNEHPEANIDDLI